MLLCHRRCNALCPPFSGLNYMTNTPKHTSAAESADAGNVPQQHAAKTPAQEKQDRLAQALRDNLARRKAQNRARTAPAGTHVQNTEQPDKDV
jgi:hypothetical protein